MSETYDITYEGARIGSAKMEKQGLYYFFSCRCRLPDAGLYRIHVTAGDRREDLGICVPMDDFFGMDKMLPVKHLGDEVAAFELLPKDWKSECTVTIQQEGVTEQVSESLMDESEEIPCEEIFVPVSEDEPFACLENLENATLAVQDGQIGIVIPETK